MYTIDMFVQYMSVLRDIYKSDIYIYTDKYVKHTR